MSARRVLVVDDHPLNVKLLTFVLRARGIEVRSAQSADEALSELEAHRPDLVLMDVQLPGTDGLTLTRRLRADARYRDLPVVAVTAYAMERDREAALAAGCDAFLSKPIDGKVLASLVEELLARGGT